MSLRSRILLLVLAASMLPALAMLLFLFEQRRDAVLDARDQLRSHAEFVAADLDGRISGTVQLLFGLARVPVIEHGDKDSCSQFLSDVLKEHPQYTGLLTILPNGELHCDSLRTGRKLDLNDRRYFQQARNSRSAVIEPVVGRITGKGVIQIAYPVRNEQNQLRYVLLASLDIESFGQNAVQTQPYAGTGFVLWNSDMSVTIAVPGTVREVLGDAPDIRNFMDAGNDRNTAALGNGSESRIWAKASLPQKYGDSLHVALTVQEADLLANLDRDFRRTLLIFAGILASLLVVAALIAEFALRRHTVRMVSAIQRMDDGIYDQPIGTPYPGGELGQVMRALDRMADAIREREASLARSEERLRATIENAPSVAIQWYDRDAICRYWNPASTAIYGFTREETVGRSLVGMFWTETQKDEFVALVREIERTGEPTPPTEFAMRHKDGRIVTVLASVFAIPDAHGGRQFVCLDIDITERKRAESALFASQQELETIFNASPVPMSVSDLARGCRIIKVNDAWVRKFGYASSDAFGKTGSEVGMYVTPEDRGRFIGRFTAGVGAYDDMELWLRHADGAQFLARVSARVVEVAGQRLMLMASEDITEERRMQAELRGVNEALEARVLQRTAALTQSNNELAAAMEHLKTAQGQLIQSEKLAALGRLVAGVAHELNTPIGNGLMAVTTLESHHRDFTQALAEGLRRSTLDAFVANVGTAADIATRNLERAAELIASFKQVAVDRTGPQRPDLQTVIEEILTSMRPTLRRSGHLVKTVIPASLYFDSFPGPLGQVLTNLIDNAARHGFEGHEGGTIRISAARLDDGQVEMRVADNGRGIAAEHLPRVFDPFFTTRLGQGGSGLGLNIVHNIVVSVLGGSVEAESTPGAGTCFILTLPATAPVAHRHEPWR